MSKPYNPEWSSSPIQDPSRSRQLLGEADKHYGTSAWPGICLESRIPKRHKEIYGLGSDMPVSIHDIEVAHTRVRKVLAVTPLSYSAYFSERLGKMVSFKWDNKLRTGSFKERGALNALELLSSAHRATGVCAASAGNHALALSFHAARLKIPCTVVMPRIAPLVKVQSTQAYGAEVILHGDTLDEAYEFCLSLATTRGLEFISAFDDERVVAGQGTCGIEILEQHPTLDAIVVPIGGGGLISGIATYIKAKRPEIFILGVQSEWAVAARAAKALLEASGTTPAISSEVRRLLPTTIADGIAVKRTGQVTQPIIDRLVDKVVTVSEVQIAQAIVHFIEFERAVVEGAGAAGLAALLARHLPDEKQNIVVLACGSNIDLNVLSRLIERDMGERGRLLKVHLSVPDRPGSLALATSIMAKEAANILEVIHDRSFSRVPGNVDITFELEVRNSEHRDCILAGLNSAGILTTVIA